MKIRKTQIKWITERYSNTREMRRNTITQSQAHSEKNTGRSNDGAPPFWVRGNGFTPQHRTAEAQSGHNTTQTHQAQVFFCFLFFFGGGALVKTKLTAGRLSPTIITSQHNITTFLRLHFQEGMKGGRGKRVGGMSLFVTCSQLGNRCTPALSQVFGLTTHLQGGSLQWQKPGSVQCGLNIQ